VLTAPNRFLAIYHFHPQDITSPVLFGYRTLSFPRGITTTLSLHSTGPFALCSVLMAYDRSITHAREFEPVVHCDYH